MFIQQGDVIIEKLEEDIPASAKDLKLTGKKITLQHGERSGHHHRVEAEESAGVAAYRDGSLLYLKVDEDAAAVVRHEEHGPVKIPSGLWIVRRVVEYDHFSEERRVYSPRHHPVRD